MKIVPLVAAALALSMASTAQAMYMLPETIPVSRLVKMAERIVREQPDKPEPHYTLARIHYLAFVCASPSLQAYTKSEPLPTVGPFQNFTTPNEGACDAEATRRTLLEFKLVKPPAPDSADVQKFFQREMALATELETSGWTPPDLADSEVIGHLTQALEQFQTAHRLAPANALYRLGYASLLEQAAAWSHRHPQAAIPESVRTITPALVRSAYLKAWQLEVAADLKDHENRGKFSPMDMVSYEAGKAFVRLAAAAPDPLSRAEKAELARVEKSLAKLDERTSHAVTPIVFATSPVSGLEQLLAPATIVDFPLRGWGPVDRWPWIKADTALLVWNPSRSGRVQSAAQLLGSYTWELFWSNGYEPLAVLDGDADGVLCGAELDGLAAWFDRNSNAISDRGEVIPLTELGVVGLATTPVATGLPYAHNPRGITFSDGRVLPTWDWVVAPVR